MKDIYFETIITQSAVALKGFRVKPIAYSCHPDTSDQVFWQRQLGLSAIKQFAELLCKLLYIFLD
jgi:hypothetical protein